MVSRVGGGAGGCQACLAPPVSWRRVIKGHGWSRKDGEALCASMVRRREVPVAGDAHGGQERVGCCCDKCDLEMVALSGWGRGVQGWGLITVPKCPLPGRDL